MRIAGFFYKFGKKIKSIETIYFCYLLLVFALFAHGDGAKNA